MPDAAGGALPSRRASVRVPGGGERLWRHATGCKSPCMTVIVRPQSHSCLAVTKVLRLLVFLLVSYNLRKKETAHDVTQLMLMGCFSHRQRETADTVQFTGGLAPAEVGPCPDGISALMKRDTGELALARAEEAL